jgi:neutral ceramidase
MNRAGWASCDITPPLGLPMGGRGPRFAAGTEVLTPLQAGVVVLEDSENNRVVLVSIDVISTDPSQINKLCVDIGSAVGASPDAVLVNTSHTHSGPMLSYERYATLRPKLPELEAYERELDGKLLRLAIEAAENLHPVQVQWRDGSTNIGINRRLKSPEGEIRMGPNPDGFYHRHLWTLDLQSTEDPKQRCVLFSHGCHPVIVYGFNWTAISSEWPGRCREILKSELGENVHFQFLQGLAGNIRPRVLADLENRKFRTATPQDVEDTAQELARDVQTTLAQDGHALVLQIGAAKSDFLAQRQAPPPREYWAETENAEDELTREMSSYWLTRYGDDAVAPYQWQPWPLGLVRFAPGFSLVHIAGEPLCEWHAIFEAALPGQKLVSCGYTDAAAGYLPTDALISEGGYEVTGSAKFSKTGPGALMPGLDNAVIQSLRRLQAAINTN